MMRTRKVNVLTASLGCLFAAVLFIAAVRVLQDRQHSWRAIVLVHLQGQKSAHLPLFDPSSPFNASLRLDLQNTLRAGAPANALKFLGVQQYRGASVLELKFSGRTENDALRLGMSAAQRWCDAVQAQEPTVTTEIMEGYTTSTLRDQWSEIRQWCRRHFGF